MSGYFLGLIIFAFVGAIILSLVPAGASKKQVRFLCGLCSIGCIAFPLFQIAGDGIDFDGISSIFEASSSIDENAVEIYKSYLNEATIKNVEETLKNDIIQGNSAKLDDIDVNIIVDKNSDEYYISEVVVYIYPSGYGIDPNKIEALCQERLGHKATIVYK